MLLRKLGYEIHVAVNGRDALHLLAMEAAKGKQFEVECILMDATMDVMDGMECTRVIRAQQLPHQTRPFIIAQTANVSEEYRAMCLSSGMVRHHTMQMRTLESTRKVRLRIGCAMEDRMHADAYRTVSYDFSPLCSGYVYLQTCARRGT